MLDLKIFINEEQKANKFGFNVRESTLETLEDLH